jgi:hypothetical protein
MTTLSSALNAELIDLDKALNNQMSDLISDEKIVVIHCPEANNHVEFLTRFIGSETTKKSNILVFFTEVPFKFSSRELYEKTGLRNIALYSSDN